MAAMDDMSSISSHGSHDDERGGDAHDGTAEEEDDEALGYLTVTGAEGPRADLRCPHPTATSTIPRAFRRRQSSIGDCNDSGSDDNGSGDAATVVSPSATSALLPQARCGPGWYDQDADVGSHQNDARLSDARQGWLGGDGSDQHDDEDSDPCDFGDRRGEPMPLRRLDRFHHGHHSHHRQDQSRARALPPLRGNPGQGASMHNPHLPPGQQDHGQPHQQHRRRPPRELPALQPATEPRTTDSTADGTTIADSAALRVKFMGCVRVNVSQDNPPTGETCARAVRYLLAQPSTDRFRRDVPADVVIKVSFSRRVLVAYPPGMRADDPDLPQQSIRQPLININCVADHGNYVCYVSARHLDGQFVCHAFAFECETDMDASYVSHEVAKACRLLFELARIEKQEAEQKAKRKPRRTEPDEADLLFYESVRVLEAAVVGAQLAPAVTKVNVKTCKRANAHKEDKEDKEDKQDDGLYYVCCRTIGRCKCPKPQVAAQAQPVLFQEHAEQADDACDVPPAKLGRGFDV
eukprot:m.110973 g.110973  ORF g.110973 m.110973 type:complete len:522 (+) comp16094_c0_seq1:298-1863(+)